MLIGSKSGGNSVVETEPLRHIHQRELLLKAAREGIPYIEKQIAVANQSIKATAEEAAKNKQHCDEVEELMRGRISTLEKRALEVVARITYYATLVEKLRDESECLKEELNVARDDLAAHSEYVAKIEAAVEECMRQHEDELTQREQDLKAQCKLVATTENSLAQAKKWAVEKLEAGILHSQQEAECGEERRSEIVRKLAELQQATNGGGDNTSCEKISEEREGEEHELSVNNQQTVGSNSTRQVESQQNAVDTDANCNDYSPSVLKMRGLLNRMAQTANLDTLCEEFIAIFYMNITEHELDEDARHPSFAAQLAEMIFAKAIREPQYISIYADLCKKLVARELQWVDEQRGVSLRFRLVSKCQDYFEEGSADSSFLEGVTILVAHLYRVELVALEMVEWCLVELIRRAKAGKHGIGFSAIDEFFVECALKMLAVALPAYEDLDKRLARKLSFYLLETEGQVTGTKMLMVLMYLADLKPILSPRLRIMFEDLGDFNPEQQKTKRDVSPHNEKGSFVLL